MRTAKVLLFVAMYTIFTAGLDSTGVEAGTTIGTAHLITPGTSVADIQALLDVVAQPGDILFFEAGVHDFGDDQLIITKSIALTGPEPALIFGDPNYPNTVTEGAWYTKIVNGGHLDFNDGGPIVCDDREIELTISNLHFDGGTYPASMSDGHPKSTSRTARSPTQFLHCQRGAPIPFTSATDL